MKKEMICIVCPVGCHISVDTDTLEVTGNTCPRGEKYGKKELTNPERVITSTVCVDGEERRCPVKTKEAIPKGLNFACMEELKKVHLQRPVKRGDVVIANVLDTGVDVVATKDIN